MSDRVFVGKPASGEVTVDGAPLPFSKGAALAGANFFAWGYAGPAPLALAFSVLAHVMEREPTFALAAEFEVDVLTALPRHLPLRLTVQEVREWLAARSVALPVEEVGRG